MYTHKLDCVCVCGGASAIIAANARQNNMAAASHLLEKNKRFGVSKSVQLFIMYSLIRSPPLPQAAHP